ncbi:MAG: ABC transporter substrate-binding protein [Elusimicrobia bacterium]|nr:ABC transporter substrate-binding protein [Elusimicrobiota bacterium]
MRRAAAPSGAALAVALAALAFCGLGCGKAPEPEAKPSAPATRIVFRYGRVSGFEAFFRQILSRFERENPGIEVVDETMALDVGQQRELYAINLQGKNGAFDLMALDIIWIAEFASAGWLAELDPWFAAEDRAAFLPAAIQAATFGGRVYALPWYADAGLLYYRKDLLEKHGHRPPETWADLVRVARDVMTKEGDPRLAGFVWQGKRYEGLVCNALEYLSSNGAEVFDEGGRWALDEERAAQALAFMSGLVHKEGVSPGLVLAADEETTRHIFGDGHAVFLRNWPYARGLFAKQGSAVAGKVGIAPLPYFPGHAPAGTLGGWFLAVNRYSKNAEAAFRLARFLGSAEVQRLVYEKIGYLPTRSLLYRDPELLAKDRQLEALARILAGARPRPVTPDYSRISEAMQASFSDVLAEVKSPRRALRELSAKVRSSGVRR